MSLGLIQAQHRPSSRKAKTSSKAPGKLQLFSFLVTSLAMLTPTQAAFGYNPAQINLAETQHPVCLKRDAQFSLCNIKPQSQKAAQTTQPTKSAQSLIHLSPAQSSALANFFICLSFLIPIGAYFGFFLYDGYSAYRTTVLKRQVERLERLWQYDSDNTDTQIW